MAVPMESVDIEQCNIEQYFEHQSPYMHFLTPLLKALKWTGDKRHIAEAMPHFAKSLELEGFCNLMMSLRFHCRHLHVHVDQIDERLLPCVFVDKKNNPCLILELYDEGFKIINEEGFVEIVNFEHSKGKIYVFQSYKEDKSNPEILKFSWFKQVLYHLRHNIWATIGITFFLSLQMVATPLYIIVVYDKFIASGNITSLMQLTLGITIALVGLFFMQIIRGAMLAVIGARIDKAISISVFERLIYLPIRFTESTSVYGQLSRLKDFESVREFFSGATAGMLVDLCFALVFLVIISLLGGWIVVVPFLIFVAMLCIIVFFYGIVKRNSHHTSVASTARQKFILETLSNIRMVKASNAEKIWEQRMRDYSADAAVSSFKTNFLTACYNAFADASVIAAGTGILVVGALNVVQGTMTIGVMIAVMILSWRVLGPIKSLFSSLTKIDQIIGSILQINKMMTIEPESDRMELHYPLTKLQGEISFQRVNFRYQGSTEPTLINVNFSIKPGELVVITGEDNSGKSSLIQLLLALYTPSSGSIHIDKRDTRQLDCIELRHAIAYVPQNGHLFYGSVRQNLLLANPNATDDILINALQNAGIYDEILALPEGLDTKISQNSAFISNNFRQAMSIARACCKQSGIILLDEATKHLDTMREKSLHELLLRLRGNTTIVMITHNINFLRMADRILFMRQGQLVLNGPPQDVIKNLPGEVL